MGGLGSQRLSLSLCCDPAKENFFLGVLLGALGVLAVYISENKFSLREGAQNVVRYRSGMVEVLDPFL
jgi:hypothetical protein